MPRTSWVMLGVAFAGALLGVGAFIGAALEGGC